MSSLTKPYTFTAGAYAIGSQVNSDFDTLYNWVNTNGIWADGSVAFTGVPSGPDLDPTANNHLTRKSYVDGKFPGPGSYIQCGNNVITTNANGDFSKFYSPAFTSNVFAVVATVANVNNYIVVINTPSSALTQFSARVLNPSNGTAIANTSFNVSWIAIGI